MNNLSILLSFTVIFISAQYIIQIYKLRWTRASNIASPLNAVYGLLSGLFSLYGSYVFCCDDHIVMSLLAADISSFLEAPIPPQMSILLQIYFLSKIWESVDILLVALQGFPINLHFRVHHNTTPLLAWALLVYPTVGGVVFMLLNTTMHIFVYLYFGGLNNSFIFYMTRIFGHIQLIAGMILSGYSFYSSPVRDEAVVVGSCLPFLLYITYFILFQMEIHDDAKAAAKAAKKEK